MKQENKFPLDNPAKSSPQDRKKSPEKILKEKQEKKIRRSNRFGGIIAILQGLLTAGVLGMVFTIDLLPFKYVGIGALVLVLLFVFTWKTQGHKGIHIVGKIFGISMIPFLALMLYVTIVTSLAFDAVAADAKKDNQLITGTVIPFRVYQGEEELIWLVNTDTHQILEVATPDKYYVTIPGVSEGKKDTVESARQYGDEAMRNTLGTLYETKVPYSVCINDDLFWSYMRIENLVLLVKPQEMISFVDNCMETNLSKGQIRQLVKLYINEEVVWELYPVKATGYETQKKTYTNPNEETLVLEPDKQNIQDIIAMMNRVEDGEKLKVSDLLIN